MTRPRQVDWEPMAALFASTRLCLPLVLFAVATTPGTAQRAFGQLGAGGGLGAEYASGAPGNGVFPAAAVGFGLAWSNVLVRADVRGFATKSEPLVTFGLAVGVPLVRSERARVYAFGAGGTGLFVEEGDPGHHVGAGVGLTTSHPTGVFVELRYDYLVGTFTYAQRQRSLGSLIAGLRFGPRRF